MANTTNQQILDKLTGLDTRLDSMDERLDSMNTRLDTMGERLDSIEARLGSVEKHMATKDDIARLERKLDDHKTSSTQHHIKILGEIGHLNQQFTKVSESQDGLGKRFSKLRIVTE